MVAQPPAFSQQTFLLVGPGTLADVSSDDVLAATSGVDWSEVHAVKLLGVALGALILFIAIRRMFKGK
jgi:hypothetical protein